MGEKAWNWWTYFCNKVTPPKWKKDDKKDSPIIQCIHFQEEKPDRGWTKMPWGKHPGSWRKCKRWWYRNRVSLSSETCKAQRKAISGLAKKGFQQRRGRQNTKLLRECIRKTWLAAGQRMLGSDWRGSPEWLHPRVGSTDFLSWSTQGTENRNCTATAWANSVQTLECLF